MGCSSFEGPGGVRGIVCTRGVRKKKCVECGRNAGRLCDWKLTGRKKGQRCNRPICDRCTHEPVPGKDLCPAHRRIWERMKEGR